MGLPPTREEGAAWSRETLGSITRVPVRQEIIQVRGEPASAREAGRLTKSAASLRLPVRQEWLTKGVGPAYVCP